MAPVDSDGVRPWRILEKRGSSVTEIRRPACHDEPRKISYPGVDFIKTDLLETRP